MVSVSVITAAIDMATALAACALGVLLAAAAAARCGGRRRALLPKKWFALRSSPPAAATARLPPGSLGWPYIGETPQFYSGDPASFFIAKQKKYGDVFKTRILGYRSVMLASPEAAKFVLVAQAARFRPTYPRGKERLIGPSALFFHDGAYHLRLRRLVQTAVGPDALRAMVPAVDAAVAGVLRRWSGVESTFLKMKAMAFDVGVVAVFGSLDGGRKEELKKNYGVVEMGYNSLPINVPGTLYRRAIKAREQLDRTLREIITERRRNGGGGGLLGRMLDDCGGALTDEQVADNIIGALFAAQDTTASAASWLIKYLHDDPAILDAVKAEQAKIYEANGRGSAPLTWAQTRSMALTHRVILECLRMASVISFTFREAIEDVEYNGFLIPKGWKVMPLIRNIHHNAEYHSNPDKFDPARFQTSPKLNTFVPFGSGIHACPGNELAKLEMLILVHRLLTRYSWESAEETSNEVEYSPFPVPKKGLPAKLSVLPAAATERCCAEVELGCTAAPSLSPAFGDRKYL